MASKVLAAMLLAGMTVVGVALAYEVAYTRLSDLKPRGAAPVLRFVSQYNATYQVYYVVRGCVGGSGLLLYNASAGAWEPLEGRACAGSLIAAPLSEAVRVGVVLGG